VISHSTPVDNTGRAPYKRFEPRAVAFAGLQQHRDWRIKVYTIVEHGCAMQWEAFAPARRLAFDVLPEPAVAPGRPGVAVLIAHASTLSPYCILAWWSRENELPTRVFVLPPGAGWRPANATESFCVWDLEILWKERELYVDTMLAGADLGAASSRYCERHVVP
jgi:hypothetical protein